MLPNMQFPVDLVTLTAEILHGKLFFCAVKYVRIFYAYPVNKIIVEVKHV